MSTRLDEIAAELEAMTPSADVEQQHIDGDKLLLEAIKLAAGEQGVRIAEAWNKQANRWWWS